MNSKGYSHRLPDKCYEIAAQHGHYDMLSYLIDIRKRGITTDVLIAAAIGGSIPILELLSKINTSRQAMITVIAADHGHLEFLQRACELSHPCDKQTFKAAITHGHVSCLEYLLDKYGWSEDIQTWTAVLNDHVDMVKFLHERGLLRSIADLYCTAARGGSLATLEYLCNIGYQTDRWDSAIAFVISGGHVECLSYLHRRGAPISESDAYIAAGCHQLDCLKYLVSNGCPWNMIECLASAMMNDNNWYLVREATIRWIREQIALSRSRVIKL